MMLRIASQQRPARERTCSAGLFVLALVLAAGVTSAAAAEASEGAGPYVVITRDGHRIDAVEKPAVEGERARVRLFPGGQLALIPAGAIDWEATEEFNASRQRAEARGSDAAVPAKSLAVPGVGDEPIRFEIIGGRRAAEAGAGEGVPDAAETGGPRSSAEGSDALSRELEDLQARHLAATEWKQSLEKRIADAEKEVPAEDESGSGEAPRTPASVRLREARASLEALREQLATLEAEMKEVRRRAAEERESQGIRPEQAASMLAALSREMEGLRRSHQEAVADRATLQGTVSELEQRVARDPARSAVQDYASPSAQRLERARSEMQELDARIEALERRMQRIRGEAVQLGGNLD